MIITPMDQNMRPSRPGWVVVFLALLLFTLPARAQWLDPGAGALYACEAERHRATVRASTTAADLHVIEARCETAIDTWKLVVIQTRDRAEAAEAARAVAEAQYQDAVNNAPGLGSFLIAGGVGVAVGVVLTIILSGGLAR